jgi:DNA-binding MltR family transcriptional regulator
MSQVKSFEIDGLSVQAKKIWDVLSEKEPTVAVLLATHFIDKCLITLLRHKFIKGNTTKKLLDHKGILGTLSNKCDIAYCLKFINKKTKQDIMKIEEIRNKFAHNHLKIDFSNNKVANLCHKLNCPKIFMEQRGENHKEDLEKIFENPQKKFDITVSWIIDTIIDDIKENINL